MIKRILVNLMSHPERTPDWAITQSDELAVHLDANLDAAISVMHIPDVSNFLARKLVGADEAIAAENRASKANAAALEARFSAITGSADTKRQYRSDCFSFADTSQLAEHARLFDLSIVPLYQHPDTRWLAEGMIFLSGRPVLLLPERGERSWSSLVIAWDGSRSATRALADALPLCIKAAKVTLLTITGDKPLADDLSPEAAARYLGHHGITCEIMRAAAQGRDAGEALLHEAQKLRADLLIMGAFGHSRMREFILGGATEAILHDPRMPILLAH